MHKLFQVGNEVEWEINSETLPGTNNTKIHSAISLDWNNLKQDGKNQVLCRIKNHPSDNPNYQESVTTNQDSERIRLKPPGTGGPKYTQQRNEVNETNELQVNTLHCK